MRGLEGIARLGRVLGRLRAAQVRARLGMRWKQWRFGRRGFGVVGSAGRAGLATDWRKRIAALRGGHHARVGFMEVAGHRFAGNEAWCLLGAGRSRRHARELPRLELWYHSFLPGWEEGWEFVRGYLADFPARTGDRVHEWHPYSVSNRLAYWLEFVASGAPGGTPEMEDEALGFCRRLTDFIEWIPELDIGANHLLKNRWAIALSDMVLEPLEGRRVASLRSYLGELESQLLGDGAHYELCPMYHAKVLDDARRMAGLIRAGTEESSRMAAMLARMEGWLELMRLGSRRWANFNDSWDIPSLASSLWGHAGDEEVHSPASGVVHSRESGFVRGTSRGGWRWLMDVGGVGPSFNPGHCHSDVLSMVLSLGEDEVVVDPGTLHYSPNDERAFLKSCQAHNGPCMADEDHTEMVGSFRVGRAARGEGQVLERGEELQCAEGWHRGYPGCEVRRKVTVERGRATVEDSWECGGALRHRPWSRWLWPIRLEDARDIEVGKTSMGFGFPSGHRLSGLRVRVEATGFSSPRMCLGEGFRSAEFGRSLPAVEGIVVGGRDGRRAGLRVTMEL